MLFLVNMARKLGWLSVSGAAWLALGSAGQAGECATCKQTCPPPFIHWAEGPPNLRFKTACPKPVCDPCTLPHYGYYATCWHPWPFAPDWSHCPTPPPGTVLPFLQGAVPAELPPVSPARPNPLTSFSNPAPQSRLAPLPILVPANTLQQSNLPRVEVPARPLPSGPVRNEIVSPYAH